MWIMYPINKIKKEELPIINRPAHYGPVYDTDLIFYCQKSYPINNVIDYTFHASSTMTMKLYILD